MECGLKSCFLTWQGGWNRSVLIVLKSKAQGQKREIMKEECNDWLTSLRSS